MSILLERIQKAALQAIKAELDKISQEDFNSLALSYYISDETFIQVDHCELDEQIQVDLRIKKM